MMKRLILISFILTSFLTSAQLITEAPLTDALLAQQSATNKANFIKRINEAVKQSKEAIKQTEFLKESKEAIETVNKVVRTSKTVSDIKKISLNLGKQYNLYVDEMNNNVSLENKDKGEIIYYYTVILNEGLSEIGNFKSLIGDGLKMNDYERITLLRAVKTKLKYQLGLLNYLHKKVETQLRKDRQKAKDLEYFKLKY